VTRLARRVLAGVALVGVTLFVGRAWQSQLGPPLRPWRGLGRLPEGRGVDLRPHWNRSYVLSPDGTIYENLVDAGKSAQAAAGEAGHAA
jgi:hypothetical protein